MPLENIVAEKIDLFMPCCHSVLPVVWIMASKTMCQVMKSINQCKPKKPSFRQIWLLPDIPDGFQANAKISIVSIIVSEKEIVFHYISM